MKEIIVVENKAFLNKTDFVCIEDIVKDLKVEYKIEKCPTSFEELKELCKKTGHYAVNILKGGLLNKEYIFIFGLSFRDNGDIEDIENNNVAENRTPQQMWQIIKNLMEK